MLNDNKLIITLDTETTSNSNYPPDFGAWPHHKDNEIVSLGMGFAYRHENECGEFMVMDHKSVTLEDNIEDDVELLITQSGKFDLHYLRRTRGDVAYRRWMKLPLWDTQIAEYILTAQTAKSQSLEELAAKYGIEFKKDESVVAHFAAGYGAETLDAKVRVLYLEGDVRTTYKVAKAQQDLATPKQMRLILMMGEVLKTAAEMEFNGMAVNHFKLGGLAGELEVVTSKLEHDLTEHFKTICSLPYSTEVPIASLDLWSMYLFGGTYEFEYRTPVGFYKTGIKLGQTRYKVNKIQHHFTRRLFKVTAEPTKKPGVYVVDEDVLVAAAREDGLAEKYLEYKKKKKLLTTYFTNIINNCSAAIDQRLHPNYNLTVAGTGRWSCSSPNMQNVPSEALSLRGCFESRWGALGCIVEIDFSAIEMVGFATINGDPQLIDDLNSKRDPHTETGKVVFGPHHQMNELERRDIKGVNFGTIYGGGANTISKQTGLELSTVKAIQKAFRGRYHIGFKTASDRCAQLVIDSPTGRRYSTQGNYTKGMNYPIQGFATGDLVPTVQAKVWQAIWLDNEKNLAENCLTINQEHDKLIFDCRSGYLQQALSVIAPIMRSAPQIMKDTYGVEMPVDTPIKVKVGPNLGEMNEWVEDGFGTWIRKEKT